MAMIVGGYMAGLTVRKARQWDDKIVLTEDVVWQGLGWAVVGGVIGARLYHVVDEWAFYADNWALIPAVWRGGLGIYGAIIGGIGGLWLFSLRTQLRLAVVLDVAAVGLALGQVIGRWGNYVNQELYGQPTEGWWGIMIEPSYRLPGYEEVARYQPLFLYESLSMLLVWGGLWWGITSGRLPVGKGLVAASYLIGYGVVRFFLDGLRLETWTVGGVAVAQLVSLLAVALGAIWWYIQLKESGYGKK